MRLRNAIIYNTVNMVIAAFCRVSRLACAHLSHRYLAHGTRPDFFDFHSSADVCLPVRICACNNNNNDTNVLLSCQGSLGKFACDSRPSRTVLYATPVSRVIHIDIDVFGEEKKSQKKNE